MTQRSQLGLVLGLAALIIVGPGCGGASSASLGATPGGAQDNGLGRDKIQNGDVPQAADITVEGMLNDHDLPLEAPPCTRTLCVRAAYGIAPALDTGRAAVFVQMGFASGIDPATFRRQPLNLAVVVDRSGSMAGAKIEAVKTALSRLIDQLDERDRLAIIMFDDQTDVLLESTPVTSRETIRAKLSQIYARGSTDMAAGLRAGFAQVQANAGGAGVTDRVMIFTDAQTNTGDTDTETFIGLAGENAANGIGLTLFGVGIDLNQQLVLAITKLRGGNYYYLQDAAKIATVFDLDFDYLVTPLAYDLRLKLEPKPGFRVAQVYGYSAWPVGSTAVEISVATLFLSRKEGALVARLETESDTWPVGKPPLAELSLAYTEVGGEPVADSLTAAYTADAELNDDSVFYSVRSVRKTVALVNAALGMRGACGLYWQGDVDGARALATRTKTLLDSEAALIEDAELTGEAQEVQKLLDNMTTTDTYQPTDPYGNGSYYGSSYGSSDHHYGCSASRAAAASPAAALLLALALACARRRRG
ncbi:MAG TPA: VWA domain-containing protein [Polyangia bacterium]|jgi:Ca-activated chloride channel family protein